MHWYDYWTGKKVQTSSAPVNLAQPAATSAEWLVTVQLHPELASLPVFVRGGAILPIAPLIQSTNERPQGPLTLRVYRGGQADVCSGSLYLDDGKTYAYRNGAFLRVQFTCNVDANGFHLHISAHEGSYPAWWKEIRAEVYGDDQPQGHVLINGREVNQAVISPLPHGVSLTFADDGKGEDLELR
jgi:alpha-glucosidase